MNYFKYLVIPDLSTDRDILLLKDFIISFESEKMGKGPVFRKTGKRKFSPGDPFSILISEWSTEFGWRMPRRLWLVMKSALSCMRIVVADQAEIRIYPMSEEFSRILGRVLHLCQNSGLSRHHSRQTLVSLIRFMRRRDSSLRPGDLLPGDVLAESAELLQTGRGGARLLLESARIYFQALDELFPSEFRIKADEYRNAVLKLVEVY